MLVGLGKRIEMRRKTSKKKIDQDRLAFRRCCEEKRNEDMEMGMYRVKRDHTHAVRPSG